MPIPRRFDRRPPERDETRTNERIRVREVRLVGDDGNQIGVVPIEEALKYAQERDLDLVEVAAEAKPPVCRVLDYSKFKYEQEQKAKQARKHQKTVNVREIKLRPKIADNDYETKKNHVVRFLTGDDRVKITIMFRGREQTHPERGSDPADAPGRGRGRHLDDRAASDPGRAQHDDAAGARQEVEAEATEAPRRPTERRRDTSATAAPARMPPRRPSPSSRLTSAARRGQPLTEPPARSGRLLQ